MAQLRSDFLWGFATAAYQIEGGIKQDGRGPSIWDTFCEIPGKIADGTSGVVACNSYNRWFDDVALLRDTGAKAYRFSISWPRIIPLGGRNDPVNQAGIDYYMRLVDDLIAAGIVPMVTLFHWDLPQALVDRYGGFLNRDEFVQDFIRFSKVMFDALSHKVKYWMTFNEPFCSAILGYNIGVFAPGRTSNREKSPVGNSATEPWIVGHSILVAHGHAVALYRKEYQKRDDGVIGIVLNGDWAEPYDSSSNEDIAACERRIEFSVSWFADPIYHGKYPDSMRAQLGDRLPEFSAEDIALVQGSNDFYGMNHYCSTYVRHKTTPAADEDFVGNVDLLPQNKDGRYIGPQTASEWLRPNAQGFRRMLKWISDRYGRPPIYVTENGTSILGENDLSRDEILQDDFRLGYFRDYIGAMALAAAEDGVDCRGYLAWSLMDNFEWADGYRTRFGCVYVDYEDGQKRYPKKSAQELRKIFGKLTGTS